MRGYAPNSPLSEATASGLGVAWATDLYGAALDSPVVAYNASLGQTLAYIGTERGYLIAVNVAGGQIVWARWLGAAIRSTLVVSAGSVFAGTANSPRIYKLNAATGAVECSVASPQPIEGTPVIASPPGGVRTLYVGTNDSVSADGPVLAVRAGNCTLAWSFTGYASQSGSWDAVSYAVDATGRPLILFGSADPDSRVYAVNAVTGATVWQYAVDNPAPHSFDIGAGVTVSPPGQVVPDGVVYVPSRYGYMYALDLTTGARLWSFNFNGALGVGEGGRSTAALDRADLVFGYNGGLAELNTDLQTMRWHYSDPSGTETLSSPAIAGAPGSEIAAAGDLGGGFDVVSLATGTQLYHYQTGGYITASPAVTGANILIASSDGFLYDFAPGGGNQASLPTTTITSPADFATLANPGGSLTVTGGAADTTGVSAVQVAVQQGGAHGPWWDAAAHRWVPGPVGNPAVLASPGAGSSDWAFSYPVPSGGGAYQVTAYAASTSGQADITAARVRVTVLANPSGPHLAAASRFVAPGAATAVTGGGFAPSEQVTIGLAGATLATTATAADGSIPRTKITIPASAPFGQASLAATGGSGDSATAAITITNNWDQLGYGPGRTGLEPHDLTLFGLVHPGANIFLSPAWSYQSGAPAGAAPAIADDVAYTANNAGQLTAIDVHNGAPLWTWTLPTNQAISGSPAVDPSRRLVFAGASDGTLDAISTTTGTLAWAAHVGGNVSAPAIGGGQVYVTSSTGTIEAVAEPAGSTTWSVTSAGANPSPPSLDTAGKTLVVGTATGNLLALSTGSGATKWTFHTGGAITTPAAIAGGIVYAGSADKSLYAVNETTGAKAWAFTTQGPVAATPVLSSEHTLGGVPEVMIGSGDGTLYTLKAADGSLLFQVPYKQPITGVAAAAGVAITGTSPGLIGASRTYSPLNVWKYQTGAPITAPPAIVDGTVYVASGDGKLYAFTPYGQLPDSTQASVPPGWPPAHQKVSLSSLP